MKTRLRNDLFLICFVIITAILLYFFLLFSGSDGNKVSVSINGNTVAEYSLAKDRREVISSEYGKNILVISDRTAFVTVADCPDEICVAHKPISKKGETIICLPHKLVIEVK